MKISLYQTNSENNRLEKILTNELKVSGDFKSEVDILNPILTLTNPDTPLFNYCYMPEISRYYFIDKVEITHTNLYTVFLHIDVLMSYKEQIKELNVIVSNSTSNPYYNGYINGYDVRTEYNKQFFENNFNENGEFVLVALYGKERGLS